MRTISGCCAKLTMVGACLLAAAVVAPVARAGTETTLTNFGSNPKNLPMYLYTPTTVSAKMPILVHLHACHATNGGQGMCSSANSFAQQADKYGFLMICPSAVSSDQCWDVHSTADLTHGGTGSDVEGIMSAVNYVIANKNGDANRVYAAGYSSGGMMTNVLLGSYPDVFKAGAAFAGVPFACFAQGSVDAITGWSSTCANGQVKFTAAQWGDLVRAAYPGYTGPRPRIQVWHGTVDTTVNPVNFTNEIAQWTNVLGVSGTPTTTENDTPQATWIRTRYIDSAGVIQVEAIQETGKGHSDLVVDPMAPDAIHFLGLDGSNPVPDGGVVTLKDGAVADSRPVDALVKMDSAGNSGGTMAAGGAAAGGGAVVTGGAGAGGVASGGVSSKGGTVAAGGVSATGGASSKGGAVGSGGTGGAIPAGGSLGSGGALATGGIAATGGSANGGSSSGASGGSSGAGSGGSTGTAAGNGSPAGCSCALTGGDSNRLPAAGILLMIGVVLASRRRRVS